MPQRERIQELQKVMIEERASAEEAMASIADDSQITLEDLPQLEFATRDNVTLRMTKKGVIYALMINNVPLEGDDQHQHSLPRQPGDYKLGWIILKTKAQWAYQLDWISDDSSHLLTRDRSRDNPGGLPVFQERRLVMT